MRKYNAKLLLALGLFLFLLFYVQLFSENESNSLSNLSRLSLVGVGVGLALNLTFGLNLWHYILALASVFLGLGITVIQVFQNNPQGLFGVDELALGLTGTTVSFVLFGLYGLALGVLVLAGINEVGKTIQTTPLERTSRFIFQVSILCHMVLPLANF